MANFKIICYVSRNFLYFILAASILVLIVEEPSNLGATKGMRFPVTQLTNNRIKGTISQTEGMDVIPTTTTQLTKQEK